MEKSIYSSEYVRLLSHLRKARDDRQLTQLEVAERLGQTQSFVSKVERGERRVDAVELRAFCMAIGISFVDFVSQLEADLSGIDFGASGADLLQTNGKQQRALADG